MSRINIQVVVGFFLMFGLLAFAFLAVKLGGIGGLEPGHYRLQARFDSVSGLKQGAAVELAGVVIGKVKAINLDPETYESVVEISLPDVVKLQQDTIASVRSTGLIGGKFIRLSPGGSELLLVPGDVILETESSINLEDLISKYIFETEKPSGK